MFPRKLFISVAVIVLLVRDSSSQPVKKQKVSRLSQGKLNNDMVFPTSKEEFDYPPEKPSKCTKTSDFCEEVDNYPTEDFRKILQRGHFNRELFAVSNISLQDDQTSRRFGMDQPSFLCPSLKKTVFPKMAKNINNKMKYIFNFEGFQQAVRVEICLKQSACAFSTFLPLEITTQCVQKYIESRLLAADPQGKPGVDYFKLPSSCACSYKRNVGFMSRFKRQIEHG